MTIENGSNPITPVESTASWTPYASRYLLPSAIASTLLVATAILGSPYILPSLINLAHKHQWIRNQADWLKMTQQIPSYAAFATIGSGAVLFNLFGIWRNGLALTETALQKQFRELPTDQEKREFALDQCEDEGTARQMLSLKMPPPPKNRDALKYKLISLSCGNLPAGVELLIRLGADVNTSDERGQTPLHYAAYNGNVDVIEVLLEAGAEKEAKDPYGSTPLHLAAISVSKNVAVIEMLLKAKAEIEATNDRGETPLLYAVRCSKIDAVEMLIGKGANINVKDNRDCSLLGCATSPEMQLLLMKAKNKGR